MGKNTHGLLHGTISVLSTTASFLFCNRTAFWFTWQNEYPQADSQLSSMHSGRSPSATWLHQNSQHTRSPWWRSALDAVTVVIRPGSMLPKCWGRRNIALQCTGCPKRDRPCSRIWDVLLNPGTCTSMEGTNLCFQYTFVLCCESCVPRAGNKLVFGATIRKLSSTSCVYKVAEKGKQNNESWVS